MDAEAQHARYEAAERASLQAIRAQHDWSSPRSKAAELATHAASWDTGEHNAWREATDDRSRNALAASTDSTELISVMWRDVALAFDGKPPVPY